MNLMSAYSRLCLYVFGLAAVASCAPQVGAAGFTAAVRTLERVFAEMEERLLSAPSLRMRYTAVSEGAFSASLSGTLSVARPRDFDLDASGTFGGSPVRAYLRSNGQVLEGEANGRGIREEVPPALQEAVILGLTRMGILHNLARLTAGAIPDRASGGVREWVSVEDLRFAPDAEGPRPGLLALRFAPHVSGQHTGDATLWVDPALGLPVHREQVVSFPGGRMHVTESYEFLDERE